MSSLGLGSLSLMKMDRRRTDRARASRRFRFGLELQLLESRITPTTVTGVTPVSGPLGGGTMVTITGTGFTAVTAVDFGTTAATNDTVVNATTITAESPPGAAGPVDVTVTAAGGTSPVSPADVFTYVAAPVVSGLNPSVGPQAGGTLVTITGSGFTGASVVDFGASPATNLTVVSDTSITVDSPAGAGTVDVTVTTPGGTSATSSADQFTYQTAPTVSGVSPNIGSPSGGTFVTITGSGFTGATAVDFGTVPATNLDVVSDTFLTVNSPAGSGLVNVTVTGPTGTSATSPADQFSYLPTVSSLSPNFGPTAGGTLVTITGVNFTGATVVDFGTSPATALTVVSDTSIIAQSPAGTGTVDVTVTTPGGTSQTSSADQFSYAPTVSGLSPSAGPVTGGTLVTITGTDFTGATAVDFGTTPATNLTVLSATSLTVDSPPGSVPVNVTVTTPSGTSATSPADLFTYVAAPSVTGVAPGSGPGGGGTVVTITGTGFSGTTAVDFGTTPATAFTLVSATKITATSPAGSGVVDVIVTTSGGPSATSPADQFTYVAAPTVAGLSPSGGPTSGGTLVTITGTGFTGATAVHFGTSLATNLTVISNTSITVTSPPGSGTVDVRVTAPGGTSPTSSADQFNYGPVVQSISPTSGPLGGGTLVTITGISFTGATSVNFGTAAATIITTSADSITAYSPAGTGTVDVTVTSPNGTSATTPADRFTYVAAPTVSAVSPKSGPGVGGTLVTITGTGFSGATEVDFGANAGTNPTVLSATTLTVTSPAGLGTVDVTVITPGGRSSTSAADQFTYVTAPAVTGLNPSFGPAAGGTLVTITGSGFTGATAVAFGTIPATDVTVVSDTSITAESPAGTGVVDVTVTTPGGTSPTTLLDKFSYAPTVSSLSPNVGSIDGGTLVTITGTGFTGASAVDFGTTPATGLTVVSATEITVNSPAGTGTVDVTVTTPAGTSVTSTADQFTYSTAPFVTGLSPAFGPSAGGTDVTITGAGFTGASAVVFGTTPATFFTVVSETEILAVSPAGTGIQNVTVTTPTGTSTTSPADIFTYGPTITTLSPTFGPSSGDTLVTITGIGFYHASAVDFGTIPSPSYIVVNSTTIMALSPAGTGAVNVTVTTPGGTSPTSSGDVFTYAPVVTLVSPTNGTASGGTIVTITGTSLADVKAIYFGTTPATTLVSDSENRIQVVSPASAVFGAVDVTVVTAGGTSATSPADQFFYSSAGAVAPRVSGISPKFGSPTGGNVVTITGTGFDPNAPTSVFFGATAATNVAVINATTITATSPAGSGTVSVTVVTYGGASSSPPSNGAQFTYVVNGPQVTSVDRYGYHAQPTYLVINFNGPLDPAPAQHAANYTIVGPGGQRIKVKSAIYNSTTNAVTLVLAQRLSLPKTYRLTINGVAPSGLTSPDGIYLDGANNGQPGSDYVTTITRSNLAGSASQRPVAAVKAKSLFSRVKSALRIHGR